MSEQNPLRGGGRFEFVEQVTLPNGDVQAAFRWVPLDDLGITVTNIQVTYSPDETPMDRMADLAAEDLLSMTDEEILAEVREDGGDPKEDAALVLALLAKARREVG